MFSPKDRADWIKLMVVIVWGMLALALMAGEARGQEPERKARIVGEEIVPPSETQHAAYAYTVACIVSRGFRAPPPLSAFVLMVADSITSDEGEAAAGMAFVGSYEGGPPFPAVVVRRDFAQQSGVWAHELLHHFLAQRGHDADDFIACDPLNRRAFRE